MSHAPGRYCAPNRCYCGEPTCPAYATYLGVLDDARAVEEADDEEGDA